MHAGTIDALESTGRVAPDLPETRAWVRYALSSRRAQTNLISKFDPALEAQNPIIREIALEAIPERLMPGGQLSIFGERLWLRGTGGNRSLELLNDPLFELVPVTNGGRRAAREKRNS